MWLSRALLAQAFLGLLVSAGCGGGGDTPASTSPPGNGGGSNTGTPPAQLGRFNGPVLAVSTVPDGTNDVVVGGAFTTYDGRPVRPVVRLRADGTVDETFTLNGTILATSSQHLKALAVTDDGSGDVYVGAMESEQGTGAPVAGRIWRVNRDGSLDATFRPAEVTDTSAGRFAMDINTLVPMGDGSGRVYVGGSFNEYNGAPAPGILRLLPTGVRDSAFNPTGGGAARLAQAKDGSGDVYVVSYQAVELLEYGSSNLYRVNSNGSRDDAFETVTVFFGGVRAGEIRCLEVLDDGSGDVLIGGSFLDPTGSGPPFSDPTALRNIARINPDGTRDRGSPRPLSENQVMAIATAVDGSRDWLLAAGTPPTMTVSRVHPDGSRDTAFGPVAVTGWIHHLVPIADGTGDWYVGGDLTSYNGTPVGHLVRVRRDGRLR